MRDYYSDRIDELEEVINGNSGAFGRKDLNAMEEELRELRRFRKMYRPNKAEVPLEEDAR